MLHRLADVREAVEPACIYLVEERLGDIALIPPEFPLQTVGHIREGDPRRAGHMPLE